MTAKGLHMKLGMSRSSIPNLCLLEEHFFLTIMPTCHWIHCVAIATENIFFEKRLCVHHRILLTELHDMYKAMETDIDMFDPNTSMKLRQIVFYSLDDSLKGTGHQVAACLKQCYQCHEYNYFWTDKLMIWDGSQYGIPIFICGECCDRRTRLYKKHMTVTTTLCSWE